MKIFKFILTGLCPCGIKIVLVSKQLVTANFGFTIMYSIVHPSIRSAPVGVQCPLPFSLFEFPGYWDWLWYSLLLPELVSITFLFAFHISVFSIHSSSPAIGFHLSIFHSGGIFTLSPTLILYPGFGPAQGHSGPRGGVPPPSVHCVPFPYCVQYSIVLQYKLGIKSFIIIFPV